MKLKVESIEGCEDESLKHHVVAVCNDVIEIYKSKVAKSPPLGPKPVILYPSPDGVPRVRTPVSPNQYDINLTCSNTPYYNQIVYQFAHELGHVYIGGLSSTVHLYSDRTNFFIESCCMAMSYICLDRLKKKWYRRPPIQGLNSYAPKLAKYRNDEIQKALKELELPSEVSVAELIKSKLHPQINKFTEFHRPQQKVFAIEVERAMNRYPNAWSVLCELGNATNEANITDFDFWRDSVRHEHRPLVEVLAQLFKV